MAFDDIPYEIKAYAQWVCWEYRSVNGKQTKVPVNPMTGHPASVNNPLDWTTFDRARDTAIIRGCGIGFVFTKSDPFCGVDLDDAEGDASVTERQQQIYNALNSYAELSPSGNGLHIIVKAALPGGGRHPSGFGIFDNKRFFTFTGNVYCNTLIEDRQEETVKVWESLGNDEVVTTTQVGDENETYTDEQVIERAGNAVNGDKFKRLWSGDWQTDYGATSNAKDKSQSSADFALIDIIAFYSRNLVQTIRVFRSSALGQRPKAQRGKYVSDMARRAMPTQTITTINSRYWFDATDLEPWVNRAVAEPVEVAPWVPSPTVAPVYMMPAAQPAQASYTFNGQPKLSRAADPVPPIQIPGLVGELAAQCWNAAAHQVAEVAIASALSTMSLLCSRTYRYGTLGLQLYLLVLADTSTGKSFGFQANDAWSNKLLNHYKNQAGPYKREGDLRAEMLEKMIMPEAPSGPGLAQHIQDHPATLMHADEFVETLRMLAQANPPQNIGQLKQELLQLTEQSAPGRMYRAKSYSKRTTAAHNIETKDVCSASLSILATGTPQQFYNVLNETLLTSGFLPRFVTLEYDGGITRRNRNAITDIEPGLFSRIVRQFDIAYNTSINIKGSLADFIEVRADDAAYAKIIEIEDEYIDKSNVSNAGTDNMAGLYGRAPVNMVKIASLIAVGCNPSVPTITVEHINIAMQIVQPMLFKLSRKFSNNEVGEGDQRLEGEIRKAIKELIDGGYQKYSFIRGLKRDLIDKGFLQTYIIKQRCIKKVAFTSQRHIGANAAFNNTLNDMIKYGILKSTKCDGHDCVIPNMGLL